MFEDFLRQHIQDLIECSTDEYKMTEKDIEEVACKLNNNDHLWWAIDRYILDELYRYIKEDEEND